MTRASLSGEGASPALKFPLPVGDRRRLQQAAKRASSNGRGDMSAVVREAVRELVWFGPTVVERRGASGARFIVRVDWDTLGAVEALAAQNGCTLGDLVAHAVRRHLDALDRDRALAGRLVPGVVVEIAGTKIL